eukprot:TRINITY_DN50109_c0_g1_i1.p1 TRINITY_DN50109_c0_g1~~TRINITY_DN50109_c0_g1_i1.p1  ORF type:complete len:275 (+),score=46.42 TRINITY_DN50109_c0_g1_i1:106-930(+)
MCIRDSINAEYGGVIRMDFDYSNPAVATRRGDSLHGHLWMPNTHGCRAVVVLFHGYGAHGNYATVRWGAEMLAQNGFAAVSADMHGHGLSPGDPRFVPSMDAFVDDAVDIAEFGSQLAAREGDRPVFLMGASMGGALALLVSLEQPRRWAGAVLLAPMLSITEESKPPPCQLCCLRCLAYLPGIRACKLIAPKGLSPEMQYRDPERRAECVNDPLVPHDDPMALATGATLLQICETIQDQLPEVSIGFLVIDGAADQVCGIEGSHTLVLALIHI